MNLTGRSHPSSRTFRTEPGYVREVPPANPCKIVACRKRAFKARPKSSSSRSVAEHSSHCGAMRTQCGPAARNFVTYSSCANLTLCSSVPRKSPTTTRRRPRPLSDAGTKRLFANPPGNSTLLNSDYIDSPTSFEVMVLRACRFLHRLIDGFTVCPSAWVADAKCPSSPQTMARDMFTSSTRARLH